MGRVRIVGTTRICVPALESAVCSGEEAKARILLDCPTGRSNCFIDRKLKLAAYLPETGKFCNVNFAWRGAFLTRVPEVIMHVRR